MNFNFSNLESTNFVGTGGQYLKPYDIYEVNLTKIERGELKGKTDPSATYPIITIEFKEVGESNRAFSENLFIPVSEKDMERPTFKNNEGHEYNRPSRFENFQFTLMQIVHALNPTGEAKIKENGSKIKTVDQFIDLVLKALKGKEKVNTFLKLVGRKDSKTNVEYAALPQACGLNKQGEVFPTNFIGEKDSLFFSNYELTQQKNYRNAKPTPMPKNEEVQSDEGDVDLNDIDL